MSSLNLNESGNVCDGADDDDNAAFEAAEKELNPEEAAAELRDLVNQQAMPMEDLLRMYGGYAQSDCTTVSSSSANNTASTSTRTRPRRHRAAAAAATTAEVPSSSTEDDILHTRNLTLDKNDFPDELLGSEEHETSVDDLISSVGTSSGSEHASNYATFSALEALYNNSFSDSDDESDGDYVPEARKEIHVGDEYQATIPECAADAQLGNYVYEQKDDLVWNPSSSVLDDTQLEEYLRRFHELALEQVQSDGASADVSSTSHVADDEMALRVLFELDYNSEAALKRLREQSKSLRLSKRLAGATAPDYEPWTDDEKQLFEDGLFQHGKKFLTIQQNLLPAKSLANIVHYYYLWKKTERHDVFVKRCEQFEKKDYVYHPYAADLMDNFLDTVEAQQTVWQVSDTLDGGHSTSLDSTVSSTTNLGTTSSCEAVGTGVPLQQNGQCHYHEHQHLLKDFGHSSTNYIVFPKREAAGEQLEGGHKRAVEWLEEPALAGVGSTTRDEAGVKRLRTSASGE